MCYVDKPKKKYAFQVYRKTPCADMSIFSASLHDPLHFTVRVDIYVSSRLKLL